MYQRSAAEKPRKDSAPFELLEGESFCIGTFGRLWNGPRSVPACRRNCSFATASNRPAKRDGFREVLFLLLRRRTMMTAAAAVGAVAAAADGLLDEDRTDREEHDSHYDQCQNDITNTHG